MLVDAHGVEDGTAFESDVCVVGAGAAGITLALTLAKRGMTVTLLESGGLSFDLATQQLYDGAALDCDYPLGAASRLRYLGGTTNHWGGVCRAFDASSFHARSWIEHSGWPIRRRDLEPYYEEAMPFLELPHRRHFEDLESDTDAYPRLLGPDNPAFSSFAWLRSPPTRFGARYKSDLERSARIRCVLNANAVQLNPSEAGDAITSLDARTLGGRTFSFSARHYVLSAGALETARLLLLSDAVVPGGIGNQHDLVGRYFMEHPNQIVAKLIVAPRRGTRGFQEEYLQQQAIPGVWRDLVAFKATPALRKKHRLLGLSLNVMRTLRPDPDPTDDAIRQLLADSPETSVTDPASAEIRTYWLAAIAEQSPSPDNRVVLTRERDALGQRKLAVQWCLRDQDVGSIFEGTRLFGVELARTGLGRIKVREVERGELLALHGHQMGTTRMADRPEHGVTDRHGRVHGMANLHIASSSLFPTSSYVNPTFTIVALTLRLAERLAAAHGARAPEVA